MEMRNDGFSSLLLSDVTLHVDDPLQRSHFLKIHSHNHGLSVPKQVPGGYHPTFHPHSSRAHTHSHSQQGQQQVDISRHKTAIHPTTAHTSVAQKSSHRLVCLSSITSAFVGKIQLLLQDLAPAPGSTAKIHSTSDSCTGPSRATHRVKTTPPATTDDAMAKGGWGSTIAITHTKHTSHGWAEEHPVI